MINKINSHFGSIDVEPDRKYDNPLGMSLATIDTITNQRIMFESFVQTDFEELIMHHEGTLNESEIEAFNEASGKGIWTKIKEFFRKAWAKIKAIFKSFFDRVRAMMTRDSKELVNKFKKEVMSKTYRDFKIKAEEYIPTKSQIKEFNIPKATDSLETVKKSSSEKADEWKEKSDNFDIETQQNTWLITSLNGAYKDFATFKADYFADVFEEGEVDINSQLLTASINHLEKENDKLKELKKMETNMNKYYNDLLSGINKIEKDKNVSEDISAKASYLYKVYSANQTVTNTLTATFIEEYKKATAFYRRVFVACVGYRNKEAINNSALIEAMMESSDFELEMQFEGIAY